MWYGRTFRCFSHFLQYMIGFALLDFFIYDFLFFTVRSYPVGFERGCQRVPLPAQVVSEVIYGMDTADRVVQFLQAFGHAGYRRGAAHIMPFRWNALQPSCTLTWLMYLLSMFTPYS